MKELLTEQEEEMLNRMITAEKEIDLRDAAEYYRSIPIPESLSDVVAETIGQYTKKEEEKIRKMRQKKRVVIALRTVGALAAAVVLFMIPLNMSEAFAKQMQGVPVLGAFAKVLTIRSYSYTENDVNVNIRVPEITVVDADADTEALGDSDMAAGPGEGGGSGALDMAAGDLEGGGAPGAAAGRGTENGIAGEDGAESGGASGRDMIADVNAEILQIVETYETDAKQRFEEYKRAFFETGGTEEEWGGRTCDVDVEYAVTYQEGTRLSLVLTTTESWAAVYAQRYYYNLDLQSGRALTLEELLGPDWKEICNKNIVAEIERRIAEDEATYWGYGPGEDDDFVDIEGFESVGDQTNFYINESGHVVVCFDKYEIAPGYMGMQEFEITDAE